MKNLRFFIILVCFLCFLVGMFRLDCYVLGEEVNAKVISTEFNQGVARIKIKVDDKVKTVKGYYSDMNKKTYTVHKKGDIITTKIDVPTSFFLIIVGAVGIIVSLYKAVKSHLIRLENENDNS